MRQVSTLHSSPPWLAVAQAEMGVEAHPPGSSNPRITAYHAGTNITGYDDKASWCLSFIHWCFGQCGVTGSGSALARSRLDWEQALEYPAPGWVVVLWRESPESWKGHVGYYLRHDEQDVQALVQAVRRLAGTTNCH